MAVGYTTLRWIYTLDAHRGLGSRFGETSSQRAERTSPRNRARSTLHFLVVISTLQNNQRDFPANQCVSSSLNLGYTALSAAAV